MSLANAAPQELSRSWSCENGLLSDLLVLCGRGDRVAFARLLDLIYPAIHTAAEQLMSPPSDRLIRDMFVSLWRHAPTYRPGQMSAVGWIMLLAGRG